MIFGLPSMLSNDSGGINPTGVFQTSNPSATLTVPAGVTSVAAVIVGGGGNGNSTSFPLAHSPGGGGRWSSNDNIPVSPGQSIRFRTVNVSVGGEIVVRYEMYINGVDGNATKLSAISGNPGDAATGTPGAGGSSGTAALGQNGQSGSATNRGGSVGGATTNTTNNSDGYGFDPDGLTWAYTKTAGYGWGAQSTNVGGNTPGGPWRAVIVWGPGKGFSAGPGSYWPFL